ncbi:MAG TPA: hypothetical protein VJZ24_02240 [Thermodesulfovibrionales bacterium]|nr:hypothetical protein [Thermodesulfovibrionales bacterium]
MKKFILASLSFIAITAVFISLTFSLPTSTAPKTTLSWTAPTTNSDGSPLTNLSGYKIYYSTTSGAYTNAKSKDVGNVLTTSIANVTGSTTTVYYFVATAYTTSGNEGGFSNEVRNDVPLVPAVPGLTVQ